MASKYLTDGHSTTYLFANGTVSMKEVSVTPPGLDGGGPNDTTTMRNTTYRTRQPKKLKTMTGSRFTAQYNPDVYTQILAQINVNQLVTINFPDGSKVQFWGWLNSFMPGDNSEGSMPTATVEVEVSNQDNSGVEQAFVYTAAP
jgi:hypothetical protein